MGRILIGLLIVAISSGLIIKTEWVVENFGTNAWAEAKLGTSGGTRLMVKFLGLAGIFIGFLAITNLHTQFLNATVGSWLVR